MARELAENLATPVFVVDQDGRLVFYNEAAERILGRSYSESGELSAEEWGGTIFHPEELDGTPLPLENLPLGVALMQKRPAHHAFRITGLDGIAREIEVTAFPLFAHLDDLVGAIAIFWQRNGTG